MDIINIYKLFKQRVLDETVWKRRTEGEGTGQGFSHSNR